MTASTPSCCLDIRSLERIRSEIEAKKAIRVIPPENIAFANLHSRPKVRSIYQVSVRKGKEISKKHELCIFIFSVLGRPRYFLEVVQAHKFREYNAEEGAINFIVYFTLILIKSCGNHLHCIVIIFNLTYVFI